MTLTNRKILLNVESLNKQAEFLDFLKVEYGKTTDTALAAFLDTTPPTISRLRAGTLVFGARMLLKVNEVTNMPVRVIRDHLGHGDGLFKGA